MKNSLKVSDIATKIRHLRNDGHLLKRINNCYIIDRISIDDCGINYNAFRIIDAEFNKELKIEIEKLKLNLRNEFSNLNDFSTYFESTTKD